MTLVIAGCASPGSKPNSSPVRSPTETMPTYDAVQAETDVVLQQILDTMPERSGEVEKRPFDPYPCNDALTNGTLRGAFYTGQWIVPVPADFDLAHLVDSVPGLLGEGWHEHDPQVPHARPSILTIRDDPHLLISVEESHLHDYRSVELMGISRCGLREGD